MRVIIFPQEITPGCKEVQHNKEVFDFWRKINFFCVCGVVVKGVEVKEEEPQEKNFLFTFVFI